MSREHPREEGAGLKRRLLEFKTHREAGFNETLAQVLQQGHPAGKHPHHAPV